MFNFFLIWLMKEIINRFTNFRNRQQIFDGFKIGSFFIPLSIEIKKNSCLIEPSDYV